MTKKEEKEVQTSAEQKRARLENLQYLKADGIKHLLGEEVNDPNSLFYGREDQIAPALNLSQTLLSTLNGGVEEDDRVLLHRNGLVTTENPDPFLWVQPSDWFLAAYLSNRERDSIGVPTRSLFPVPHGRLP